MELQIMLPLCSLLCPCWLQQCFCCIMAGSQCWGMDGVYRAKQQPLEVLS